MLLWNDLACLGLGLGSSLDDLGFGLLGHLLDLLSKLLRLGLQGLLGLLGLLDNLLGHLDNLLGLLDNLLGLLEGLHLLGSSRRGAIGGALNTLGLLGCSETRMAAGYFLVASFSH